MCNQVARFLHRIIGTSDVRATLMGSYEAPWLTREKDLVLTGRRFSESAPSAPAPLDFCRIFGILEGVGCHAVNSGLQGAGKGEFENEVRETG